jgi:uncharacterized protein YggU (UPF0235/DUF167 family)
MQSSRPASRKPNSSSPRTGKSTFASDEPWRATPDGVVVACRLKPKGGRDAIDGVARLSDGSSVLVARVRAAPEDGGANDALCVLLAAKLDLAASQVRVAAGAKSRMKRVVARGNPEALIARLRAL